MSERSNIATTASKYLGCNQFNGSHKKIIDVYNAHKPLPRGYAVKYTDPWCATFVSFVFIECQLVERIPLECSCYVMQVEASKRGIWVEDDSYHAEIGDLVLYDWADTGLGDNMGVPDHIGIVTGKLPTSGLIVVEGNKDGMVGTRELGYNSRFIRGFITPKYNDISIGSEPKVTDIDSVARLVIRGDYGNGMERRQRLRAAGWTDIQIDQIQSRVNAILS